MRSHIFVTMTLQCNLESGTMVPIAPLLLLRYFGYLGSFVITFVFLFYFGEEWSFDEDHIESEHDSGNMAIFHISNSRIHEHGKSLHILVSLLCVFFSVV